MLDKTSDSKALFNEACKNGIVSVYMTKDNASNLFYFYVPTGKTFSLYYDDPSSRNVILDIFTANCIAKTVYNSKEFFKFFSGHKIRSIFCVKLAAQIVTAGLSIFGEDVDLKAISDFFIGIDYDTTNGNENVFRIYELYLLLNKALEDLDLIDTARLEFKVARVIADMEMKGIYVDKTRLLYLKAYYETDLEALEDYIKSVLGSINVNSPEQVKDALNKLLNLNLASTDSDTLSNYMSTNPVIEKIIKYRKLSYLLSSFSHNIIESIDSHGRIHPTFCQNVSATGRIIAINPSVQNIANTDDIISCFTAPEGRTVVSVDYKQMEAFIIAEISQDENLINLIRAGKDIHRTTASEIVKKDIEEINDVERKKAKGAFYGLSYLMGIQGYINKCKSDFNITLNYTEAKNIVNNFFKYYRGIQKWHETVKSKDIYSLIARSIGGRARFFRDKASATEFLNMMIQGTGADIIKEAMVMVHKNLPNDAFINNEKHDQLYVECDYGKKNEITEMVSHLMSEAARKYISFLKEMPDDFITSIK